MVHVLLNGQQAPIDESRLAGHEVEPRGDRQKKAHLHRQVPDGESLEDRDLVRGIAIKLSTPFVPLDGV